MLIQDKKLRWKVYHVAHAIDENQYNRIHGIVGWDCHGILACSLRDSDCSRIL
jgi:hypothetical protein